MLSFGAYEPLIVGKIRLKHILLISGKLIIAWQVCGIVYTV